MKSTAFSKVENDGNVAICLELHPISTTNDTEKIFVEMEKTFGLAASAAAAAAIALFVVCELLE